MRLRQLVMSGCISAVLVVLPASASTEAKECLVAKPTAASYTWNFSKEANNIFEDIQSDAWQARYHAEQAQSFALGSDMSWQSYTYQLSLVESAVNNMGDRLCRLETIRRVVAPWQQRTIDRIAVSVRLMADNAQDAILFGNNNPRMLWSPAYHKYLDNLYSEAQNLTASVGTAVEYAKIGPQYQELRKDIGMRASS